jgi:hypothetical protein
MPAILGWPTTDVGAVTGTIPVKWREHLWNRNIPRLTNSDILGERWVSRSFVTGTGLAALAPMKR